MKQKGFTLIELLAVIIILAIIALIATPIILNMINDAKKNAAVNSTYGYINAVELYQSENLLKNKDKLSKGQYGVNRNTAIGDKQYDKINNLIDLKGIKPTAGTITILENGTVGSAILCMKDYIVEYTGGVATLTSNNCEDISLIVDFTIDSFNWETSKNLTITYPKGNYEYYYKVESGKVLLGESEITNGEEIKATNNVVTLKLQKNSKISAWIIKDNKKISLKNYEETKIDNVELGKPTIIDLSSTPIIYSNGIEMKEVIGIDFEKQEGTSAYYSLDNGKTWKKYTKEIPKAGTKIKAKLVRDGSKRESETVEADIIESESSRDKTFYPNLYDGDENTATYGTNLTNKNVYLRISDEMQNKKIKIKWRDNNSSDIIYHVFLNVNKEEISNTKVTLANLATVNTEYYVPSNARYLLFYIGYSCQVYEVSPVEFFNEIITKKYEYPTITSTGIKNGGEYIEIIYSHPTKYKIDNGEYKNYNSDLIYMNAGQKIFIETTNNETSEVKTYEYIATLPSDAIGQLAYDEDPDKSTFYSATNKTTKYIYIDESAWGKKLNIKSKGYQYLTFYDSIGGKVVKDIGDFRTTTNSFVIPNGAHAIYYYFNESGGVYDMTVTD
ncbi:MAG: prepilin-type N-terminal cleavage/methylation domain-containing protein [Bacilli bacterium]|nr:prepilin-type N-terminal cleavage/methylation domain-containing protein [Bacilli bacterium]